MSLRNRHSCRNKREVDDTEVKTELEESLIFNGERWLFLSRGVTWMKYRRDTGNPKRKKPLSTLVVNNT